MPVLELELSEVVLVLLPESPETMLAPSLDPTAVLLFAPELWTTELVSLVE